MIDHAKKHHDPQILPPWESSIFRIAVISTEFRTSLFLRVSSLYTSSWVSPAHFQYHFLSLLSPQSPQKHLLNWRHNYSMTLRASQLRSDPYLCSIDLCLSGETFPWRQTRTPVRCNFPRYLTWIKYPLPLVVLWLFRSGFLYITLKPSVFLHIHCCVPLKHRNGHGQPI